MYHHILVEHDARVVLQRIALGKVVNFRDLDDSLKRDGVVRNDARGVVEQLVEQGLIEKQEAPISDFDTFYLSEDGQAAYSTLEHLRPRLRDARPRRQKAV